MNRNNSCGRRAPSPEAGRGLPSLDQFTKYAIHTVVLSISCLTHARFACYGCLRRGLIYVSALELAPMSHPALSLFLRFQLGQDSEYLSVTYFHRQ
jgi:hypothetical protein